MNTSGSGACIETPAPLNSLTELERMTLVENSTRTCAHEARAAARTNRAHEFEDLEQEALLACVCAALGELEECRAWLEGSLCGW